MLTAGGGRQRPSRPGVATGCGTLALMKAMPPLQASGLLFQRLDALAMSLARRDDALALLALGSVGRETERLDPWSDLDFFVLVREGGAKARYIGELDWLAEAHPLVWHFQNTVDGHKALMADGVYCEFAVFEVRELSGIAFAPGRFHWRRDEVDCALAEPRCALPGERGEDWLVGEALSNLLIGLQRDARGECLAAMRLIQVHALDRLLELRERRVASGGAVRRDPFNIDRRIEQRQDGCAAWLPGLAAGYAANAASALAILAELDRCAELPLPLVTAIRALAARNHRQGPGTGSPGAWDGSWPPMPPL